MLLENLNRELRNAGAVLVGYGDLAEIPAEKRYGLPVGICVAVVFQKKTIYGIHDMPTLEYFHQYHILNDKLDEIVTYGADYLKKCGYNAIAKTREVVDEGATDFETVLPHKTIATRAGLGWIGKCALLVTKEFGSMIRISTILTDAPLETAQPINASECGTCKACRNACPADAVSGKLWDVSMERERFWDARACRETARRRSFEGFGREVTLCGKCIEVCPYTRRYLNKAE